MRRIAFAVASAWVLSAGWAILSASGAQSSPAPAPATANASLNPRAVVDRYCVTCHNQRTKTSDLALDGVDITTPPAHGEIWENVVRRLRTRSMPPQGMPRPDDATYEALATYLETELDQSAAAKPSTSMLRRSCRPMIRRSASTTSPIFWGRRPHFSSGISLPPIA